MQHHSAEDALTWNPLRLLSFYRVILAALLAILFFGLRNETSLGQSHPGLYGITSLGYLLFSLVCGFSSRLRWPGFELQAVAQVLVDIAAITLLMFASGGSASGLGILLVISVATGNILLTGRMAFLFAAFATITVMGEHFYRNWPGSNTDSSDFTQAGLLGLTFFATAAVTSLLVRRIHESEALARSSAVDAANLANLNAHIVRRLQAGIIVTDHDDRIRLINDTARTLLRATDSHQDQPLSELSAPLYRKLLAWRQSPDSEPTLLFLGHDTDSVLPHFTRLGIDTGQGALIFLEDTAAIIRQTQQIKLASLGRLTASIAHEIRNPLGAISHAAQLLGEDTSFSDEDRRLMSIIDDNAGRVNAIVENILQLSRPVQSVPQTIRLSEWLNRFAVEFVQSGNCDPDRIRYSVEPEHLEIRMDPSLLHQIVWNLCQNAMQHGRPGQAVRLRLVARRPLSDKAPSLEIIDN
ncbi:MAG: histidine kinase dimerization/phospho-acceptor domain-containing protein, partial [Thiohalobacterales bacterium]|nr:histidine kinase dimerization/phospho-acceptor domain-containing protein [Thiohalobacterales bacterium]